MNFWPQALQFRALTVQEVIFTSVTKAPVDNIQKPIIPSDGVENTFVVTTSQREEKKLTITNRIQHETDTCPN